jgi:hypothetical protein
MANRPANAGSDSAGPDSAYDWERTGAPPPVHHQDLPRTLQAAPRHRPASAIRPGRRPQGRAEHRPQDHYEHRPQERPEARHVNPGPPKAAAAHAAAEAHVLAWLPYLIVLAGAAFGLFVAWQGSRHAGLGTGLVGGALLAAAAARLLLPPRYAGPLSSRHKAHDVAGFAVFGAAVLAIALTLP